MIALEAIRRKPTSKAKSFFILAAFLISKVQQWIPPWSFYYPKSWKSDLFSEIRWKSNPNKQILWIRDLAIARVSDSDNLSAVDFPHCHPSSIKRHGSHLTWKSPEKSGNGVIREKASERSDFWLESIGWRGMQRKAKRRCASARSVLLFVETSQSSLRSNVRNTRWGRGKETTR